MSGLRNKTVTLEFVIQDWDEGDIVSVRTFYEGQNITLTKPAQDIIFDLARRFRVVNGAPVADEDFLHIDTALVSDNTQQDGTFHPLT